MVQVGLVSVLGRWVVRLSLVQRLLGRRLVTGKSTRIQIFRIRGIVLSGFIRRAYRFWRLVVTFVDLHSWFTHGLLDLLVS